jgi:hypothetical protein
VASEVLGAGEDHGTIAVTVAAKHDWIVAPRRRSHGGWGWRRRGLRLVGGRSVALLLLLFPCEQRQGIGRRHAVLQTRPFETELGLGHEAGAAEVGWSNQDEAGGREKAVG